MTARMLIETKKRRRFTHARLVDATGAELAVTLCELIWEPGLGLMPFESFEFKVQVDGSEDGEAQVIIEQDPLTDLFVRYPTGKLFSAGDTLLVAASRSVSHAT